MINAIDFAKQTAIKGRPHDGCYVEYNDMSCYDTLQLAKYASEGKVLTFVGDGTQLEMLSSLLESNFQDNVHMIAENFSHVDSFAAENLDGAFIFANKSANVKALIGGIKKVLKLLAMGANLLIITDNEEFFKEAEEVCKSLSRKTFSVVCINQINDTEMPYAILAQKVSFDEK